MHPNTHRRTFEPGENELLNKMFSKRCLQWNKANRATEIEMLVYVWYTDTHHVLLHGRIKVQEEATHTFKRAVNLAHSIENKHRTIEKK